MSQETGQYTRHQPAIVFDGSSYHMVFASNDNSNRILYVTSSDGLNDWSLGPGTGQTTSAAPALALYQYPSFAGPPQPNLLVLVFVANDPSNRILYSTLDLNEAPNTREWRFVSQLGQESAKAVFALETSPNTPEVSITVYFESNDPSNRLLEFQFTP